MEWNGIRKFFFVKLILIISLSLVTKKYSKLINSPNYLFNKIAQIIIDQAYSLTPENKIAQIIIHLEPITP
ncbi:hypothetical protein Hanom_Chr03g00214861 [Helianthus anomalus]